MCVCVSALVTRAGVMENGGGGGEWKGKSWREEVEGKFSLLLLAHY